MSKYGIKIKNFQAGSLYGYNNGTRDKLHSTDAMLTNSLFSDFMVSNGLNVWKGESTRDIICIEFDYGVRDYQGEINNFDNIIKKIDKDETLSLDEKQERIDKINFLIEKADKNQHKYVKKNTHEIREEFYTNGVDINYKTYNKKGNIIKEELIHYKMLYRTPGKAKKGSCMFINEKLYDVARDFLYMGITLPDKNAPIVEIGAYSSLITSSIVGKVQIKPEEILVIEDVDSFFKTNVISVETDENKHCIANPIDNYELKNTLFDGQALIDTSIFPEWGDGYVLLRHHMCKMAAFHANIELFMREHFKEYYDEAYVDDMWGNPVKVSNIKLITTDNAMKWLKFNKSYAYWAEWVRKNDCMFGVVKTAHQSKLGEVQRMSYQMINALDLDIMPQVLECSINYINKLKTDDDVFLNYLRDNQNFSNDYEVLIALVEQNREFLRSEYFRNRKRKIIEAYVFDFKNGKIIQNADNLVIVGSPYAMLLHSVGINPFEDDTFTQEDGTIQCYTKRFNNMQYLAEFRSPFNSKNNMGYLHNVYHDKLEKYFNLGKQIIAVNMINTDFQDRNNGSDQDSDSLYVTDQPDIVAYAKYCYSNYPTIVNNIPKEKNSYNNTLLNFAKIDNNLSDAQAAIGESSNLAQICLTYTYNANNEDDRKKYEEYVCILSVLAQVAIDNAKRRFDIDLVKEIEFIKDDMDIPKNKRPSFWTVIRKDFNKNAENIQHNINKIKNGKMTEQEIEELTGFKSFDDAIDYLNNLYKKKNKINKDLKCPMNYIFDVKIDKYKSKDSTLPMSDFFVKYELNEHRRKCKKVEELIQKYSFDLYNYNIDENDDDDQYLLLRHDFDKLIEDIQSTYVSKNYLGLMSWLINRAFNIGSGVRRNKDAIMSTINTNKAILLKTLYTVNPDALLKCFVSKEKVDT